MPWPPATIDSTMPLSMKRCTTSACCPVIASMRCRMRSNGCPTGTPIQLLADHVGGGQLGARREGVALRQDDVELLAQELGDDQAALAPAGQHARRVGDHDVVVEREVEEVGQQRVLVAADHPQAGDAGDPVQRARQQHLADRREHGDGHLAARLLDEVRPDRLGLLDGDGEILRGLGEHAARRREGEAAAGALRQGDAGLALERLELLRDGRRREVQRLRDGGHGAAVGELSQQPESAHVHVVRLHPYCSFIRLC